MAVYSMTGYASAASEPGATGPAVPVEARSVNGRFLDLALRLPDELRGLEPALRELLTAAFRRGKIELRMATAREADGAWPTPTHRAAQPPGAPGELGPGLAAAGAAAVGRTRCCTGAARAAPRNGWTSRRWPPLRCASRACARPARAKARGWRRCCWSAWPACASWPPPAAPLVPAVVQRQQARFLERWNEALAAAQAGASIPAEALRERALGEAATFAHPHRRGRGTGPPGFAPERDRAPARGRRRGRQAAGLPDPGTAARGQHPGHQVGGAGADHDLRWR